MEYITNHIPMILSLLVISITAMEYLINKDFFRTILGGLFTIFVFGFSITYEKYSNDITSKIYVIVDYGFVLLCFFLFMYMINEATMEE